MNFKYKWKFLKIIPALWSASVCRAGGLFGQERVDRGHSEFGTTVNLGLLHRTLCRRLRMLDTAVQRLNSWLDAELKHSVTDGETTASRSLLPVKQKLSPRLNSWPETQASMMLPKKKRSKPTGDKSYGAGQASGKKAKTLTVPLVPTEVPASNAVASVQKSKQNPPSSHYRPKTRLY